MQDNLAHVILWVSWYPFAFQDRFTSVFQGWYWYSWTALPKVSHSGTLILGFSCFMSSRLGHKNLGNIPQRYRGRHRSHMLDTVRFNRTVCLHGPVHKKYGLWVNISRCSKRPPNFRSLANPIHSISRLLHHRSEAWYTLGIRDCCDYWRHPANFNDVQRVQSMCVTMWFITAFIFLFLPF